MRCLAIFALLLSASPAFPAWKETGNSLVRFVCQAYYGDELEDEVIVVEQLSVDTVDGSLHIVHDDMEGGRGEENRFRMKMHMDASLVPPEGSGKTKQEIIRDLLSQPATLNPYNDRRMEYEGEGYRVVSSFVFVSDDESKAFEIPDLKNPKEGYLENSFVGGMLQCEEPELLPERIWVED